MLLLASQGPWCFLSVLIKVAINTQVCQVPSWEWLLARYVSHSCFILNMMLKGVAQIVLLFSEGICECSQLSFVLEKVRSAHCPRLNIVLV